MKTSRRYTAQELRSASLWFSYPPNSTKKAKRFDGIEIAQMLRQAAEMRDRAEEVRARHALYYGKVDYEIETVVVDEVDYILRGDAGRAEK